MPDIHTRSDWWRLVRTNWIHLEAIIAHHIDLAHPAYETPGNDKSAKTGRTIHAELLHLRAHEDRRLARYFHAAWGLASEAYAWSVPAWGLLCDLCSEEWVLENDERDSEEDRGSPWANA